MPDIDENREMPLARPRGTIAWLTNFSAVPSGSSLRIRNFCGQLRNAGYRVFLIVPHWTYDRAGLQHYVDSGLIDGYSRFQGYQLGRWHGAFSRLLVHPAAQNACRRREQRKFASALVELIQQYDAGVLLMSERMHLFAIPELRRHTRVVIDWCDSFALSGTRDIIHKIRTRRLIPAASAVPKIAKCILDEQYYPRLADANIVVSPADCRVFKRLSNRGTFHILPNGVEGFVPGPSINKVPDRLIFTGVMDFPPNISSALWFIDKVLPVLRAHRPGVHFVIAGRDPADVLRQRANAFIEVTGEVPDMFTEIARAQLYVAPLVSGSGFRNKVMEALAAGTPVVGTHFAAEFLPEGFGRAVTVADGPAPMAHAILRHLEDPLPVKPDLDRARKLLEDRYSWSNCTAGLLSVLDPCGPDQHDRTAEAVSSNAAI